MFALRLSAAVGACEVPCYHPIPAWQLPDGAVVFQEGKTRGDGRSLDLPCGRCVGCRLERSRQWAARILHESRSNAANCFITLTYSPDHLPEGGTLRYADFQRFMKRLRKRYGKVRFYMCGEYGEQLQRPHYHACLFGVDFASDRRFLKKSGDHTLWRSPSLEELWPYGHSSVAELSFETAAYTARYIMKKITGQLAEDHYRKVDPETGEVFQLEPEFNRMSLKPGIGAGFLERFGSDVYPHDYVVVNGVKSKPPRYYDKKLSKADPLAFDDVKVERELRAAHSRADNTVERLAVKEQVAIARLNQLKRDQV